MLGELERSRRVFKGLDTSQKCVHAVLAWKSGMKSAAWMLTWDLDSFFVRYFNNRRLILRLVLCFGRVLIPVNHFAVGTVLITFLAEAKYKGMSDEQGAVGNQRSMYLEGKATDLELETALEKKCLLDS